MPSYKSHYLLNKQFCFPVWASLQRQAAVHAFVITDTLYKKLWHVSDRLIKGEEQPSWDLDSIVILPLASSAISTARCKLSTLHFPTCKTEMGTSHPPHLLRRWDPHPTGHSFNWLPSAPVIYVWFKKGRGQTQAFRSTWVSLLAPPAVAQLLHSNCANPFTVQGAADHNHGDGKTDHKKVTHPVTPWAAAQVVPQVSMSSSLSSHSNDSLLSATTLLPHRVLVRGSPAPPWHAPSMMQYQDGCRAQWSLFSSLLEEKARTHLPAPSPPQGMASLIFPIPVYFIMEWQKLSTVTQADHILILIPGHDLTFTLHLLCLNLVGRKKMGKRASLLIFFFFPWLCLHAFHPPFP